ncbi:MAG TPA: hypothetical protein O0X70_01685 [Methanocorpusculum sp.]|nr:hypothetical protein [Methanocorpusculum sp.]
MSKGTTIAITAVCILAVVIIAGIVMVGTGMITFNLGSGNQGASAAPTYAAPTAAVQTPVPQATTGLIQTPAAGAELTSLQKEGISLLAGKWYGNDPISVKVLFTSITMPSEFNAEARDDFTASFWGTVDDVPTMDESLSFYINVIWEYKGNNQFTGTTDDGSLIEFTCDGAYINMVVNPYQHGLTDNSMANMDIPIKLHKV